MELTTMIRTLDRAQITTAGWWVVIVAAVLVILGLLSIVGCIKTSKLLSSNFKIWQISGAICKHWVCLLLFFVGLFTAIFSWFPNFLKDYPADSWFFTHTTLLFLITLFFILLLFIHSARTLSKIFTLRKEEIWITVSQIVILIFLILIVGIAYVYFGSVLESFLSVTCISSVLGWIFQDSLKGAATFVKFRTKGLLNIGDWIKIDKSNVDGRIKAITLTTLYLENWDSTTSSIPMSILFSGNVQNLQRMNDGRTNGRRMLKEFIIDSSWVHMLDKNDITKLESVLGKEDPFFQEQVKEGKQNIQVCREYLNYYLHTHPRVSHEPRLIVRWMKHTQEGLTLQLYAFLMDTSLVSFEKTQSEIFEHTIKSLSWFGLQLYQTPSSYDSKSSTIYLANKNETE